MSEINGRSDEVSHPDSFVCLQAIWNDVNIQSGSTDSKHLELVHNLLKEMMTVGSFGLE